jgi:hypothetical protein
MSLIDIDHVTHQEVFTENKLRVLEAQEEYFWLTENTRPVPVMVLAEVEGSSTVEAWRDALCKVQQRYPLLSARIRKIPGERPYFERLPDTAIPLRVMPLEGVNFDALMAQEPLISFGYADGLMARVTLCHSPERCAVLLSVHHAAYDGLSNVQILCDMIAAAAGETLGGPFPLVPAIGEFFGLDEPGPYAKWPEVKKPSPKTRYALPSPKLQRRIFQLEEMKALRAAARAEHTTVQGALVAAFLLAGRRASERWRNTPIVCISPINLRPMLNLEGFPGMLLRAHPSVMQPSDDFPFWDFARDLKHGLRFSATRESTTLGLNTLRKVMRYEGDPDNRNTIDPDKVFHHDLMVSNYGDLGIKTDFGDGGLRLKSLYPSVCCGDVETQTISAITVDGSLYLTHISRHPLPSLMTDAFDILRDACAAFSPEVH